MPHDRNDWLSDLNTMQQRMERLLNHISVSKPPQVHFSPRVWAPLMDVYETPEEVVVLVELAGVALEDVDVSLDRDDLLIRGERQDRRPEKRRTYHQMEISCGPFERRVHLPAPVDPERAAASYQDGFVQIILPKLQPRRARRVDIKVQ